MIINKNRKFCSFCKLFMFNLEQFQFSNVSKTHTGKQKNQIIENNTQHQNKIEQNQQSKVSFSKNKSKSFKLVLDPCRTYQKIYEWRKTYVAPVDTIGCQRLSQSTKSEQIKKYQTLVSLMISVQTSDYITSLVIKRLQQYGLTAQKISQTPQSKMIQLIHQANFHKRKAKNIIEVSKRILQIGLPKNQQQLLELPGVGVKIAMIYLRIAEGVIDGIGVDTHVHRISNKLGWLSTNNPNQTQLKLRQIFPKNYWSSINITLVGFGQILCNAKKPLCSQCPVNFECPSSLMKIRAQW